MIFTEVKIDRKGFVLHAQCYSRDEKSKQYMSYLHFGFAGHIFMSEFHSLIFIQIIKIKKG